MWGFLVRILLHLSITLFAYLIHSFQYLIENKGDINYLYGSTNNIPDIIREIKPYLTDWSVTSTVVMTMRQIVGGIVKKHASSGEWLISESIVDTVRVYIYISLLMIRMRFLTWGWTRLLKSSMVWQRLDI